MDLEQNVAAKNKYVERMKKYGADLKSKLQSSQQEQRLQFSSLNSKQVMQTSKDEIFEDPPEMEPLLEPQKPVYREVSSLELTPNQQRELNNSKPYNKNQSRSQVSKGGANSKGTKQKSKQQQKQASLKQDANQANQAKEEAQEQTLIQQSQEQLQQQQQLQDQQQLALQQQLNQQQQQQQELQNQLAQQEQYNQLLLSQQQQQQQQQQSLDQYIQQGMEKKAAQVSTNKFQHTEQKQGEYEQFLERAPVGQGSITKNSEQSYDRIPQQENYSAKQDQGVSAMAFIEQPSQGESPNKGYRTDDMDTKLLYTDRIVHTNTEPQVQIQDEVHKESSMGSIQALTRGDRKTQKRQSQIDISGGKVKMVERLMRTITQIYENKLQSQIKNSPQQRHPAPSFFILNFLQGLYGAKQLVIENISMMYASVKEYYKEDKRVSNFKNFLENVWDSEIFSMFIDVIRTILQTPRLPCVDFQKMNQRKTEGRIYNDTLVWLDYNRAVQIAEQKLGQRKAENSNAFNKSLLANCQPISPEDVNLYFNPLGLSHQEKQWYIVKQTQEKNFRKIEISTFLEQLCSEKIRLKEAIKYYVWNFFKIYDTDKDGLLESTELHLLFQDIMRESQYEAVNSQLVDDCLQEEQRLLNKEGGLEDENVESSKAIHSILGQIKIQNNMQSKSIKVRPKIILDVVYRNQTITNMIQQKVSTPMNYTFDQDSQLQQMNNNIVLKIIFSNHWNYQMVSMKNFMSENDDIINFFKFQEQKLQKEEQSDIQFSQYQNILRTLIETKFQKTNDIIKNLSAAQNLTLVDRDLAKLEAAVNILYDRPYVVDQQSDMTSQLNHESYLSRGYAYRYMIRDIKTFRHIQTYIRSQYRHVLYKYALQYKKNKRVFIQRQKTSSSED